MVIKEFFGTRNDGVNLYRNYSDAGKKILQNETGVVYDEAIDVEDAPYTYTETEEDVEGEEVPDDEAIRILMGGEEE